MPTPTRLFDILPYRKATVPERPVFVSQNEGSWRRWYVDELIEQANLASYALMAQGVHRGDKVAILSRSCPEWNICDIAVMQIGAIVVPFYCKDQPGSCSEHLEKVDVSYLFVETQTMARRARLQCSQMTAIKNVCYFNGTDPDDDDCVCSLASLLEMGRQHVDEAALEARKQQVDPVDCATIIFTSGTTGDPKPVMLSHVGMMSNFVPVQNPMLLQFSRMLSVLSLSNISERLMNYMYQYLGYEIYYPTSYFTALEALREIKPQVMNLAPKFVERAYDGIYRYGNHLQGKAKKLYYKAVHFALDYDAERRSLLYRLKKRRYNRLVFSEIRRLYGGELKMITSSGSMLQPRLVRFFSCLDIAVFEGYGLVEASAIVAATASPNRPNASTVGFPMPGKEVRVLPENNEIVCRSAHMMLGYYGQDAETQQAIDADGWLHTGDTGVMEADGQLRFTGRTKIIFKTADGRWVNPEIIEEKFKESPFVLDMMVVGEGQKHLAAVILPDFDFLKEWQERHGIVCQGHKAMLADSRTQERYRRVVDKYNQQLDERDRIDRYVLFDDVWSVNNGCLTPNLRIKRKIIEQRCKSEIMNLFVE